MLHTELNHRHVPSVPTAHREECLTLAAVTDNHSNTTLSPQKLHVSSFSLDSIFFFRQLKKPHKLFVIRYVYTLWTIVSHTRSLVKLSAITQLVKK